MNFYCQKKNYNTKNLQNEKLTVLEPIVKETKSVMIVKNNQTNPTYKITKENLIPWYKYSGKKHRQKEHSLCASVSRKKF
jgi:hypothetical protein